MLVKIQMKAFDETGRRVAVEEVYLPSSVSAEAAAQHIKNECRRLADAPYPEKPSADDRDNGGRSLVPA